MRRTLESLFSYVEFAACTAAWLPLLAGVRALHSGDALPRVPGRWLRAFGRATSALTPMWRFSIEGQAPPDIDRRPYVVVANHASNADPFLLSWLDWDMQWVGKDELFRTPVVGWMLRLGGDIRIRRGSSESVKQMLDQCRTALRGGLSLMMFPEGTRSRDGSVRAFKDGAFQLALEEGVPILPVAIAGTHRCMPKGQGLGRARAIARILPAIDTRGLGVADLPRVRDEARARIAACVAELDARIELEEPELAAAPSAVPVR